LLCYALFIVKVFILTPKVEVDRKFTGVRKRIDIAAHLF